MEREREIVKALNDLAAFLRRINLRVVTPPSNDSWYNQGRR